MDTVLSPEDDQVLRCMTCGIYNRPHNIYDEVCTHCEREWYEEVCGISARWQGGYNIAAVFTEASRRMKLRRIVPKRRKTNHAADNECRVEAS